MTTTLGFLWRRALPAVAIVLSLAGVARAQPSALLVNERRPLPGVLTGGMPEGATGFQGLAGVGVRTFVDLRSDSEVNAETRSAAEAAGLSYERVPVRGEVDLDLANARALDALLDDQARYPVAVVCASGNRVGALLAVRAFWLESATPEAALALGRAAGLTRLEPAVRSLLGLPPAPDPNSPPSPTQTGRTRPRSTTPDPFTTGGNTMAGYLANIEKKSLENRYFREVLFTGSHMQLVVMSLAAGEDIGLETHDDVDQFIRVEGGKGKAILNGEEYALEDGSAVVIPAGTRHNIVNVSETGTLKLYSIYSPPEHPAGTIHKSKAEALAYEKEHHRSP